PREWTRPLKPDIDAGLALYAKLGDALKEVRDYLKTHDIIDDMRSPPRVLRFLDDPIGFLRYCEGWLSAHDATSPQLALFRHWHDELSDVMRKFMTAVDGGASVQAGVDKAVAFFTDWGITLSMYQGMKASHPDWPPYPKSPPGWNKIP